MNRKMRARANNAAAKARKERKPCPSKDTLMQGKTCDRCGEELVPIIGVFVPLDDAHGNETLH